MMFTTFSFPSFALVLLITAPCNHGMLGKTSNNSEASAVQSECPKSQCLVSLLHHTPSVIRPQHALGCVQKYGIHRVLLDFVYF